MQYNRLLQYNLKLNNLFGAMTLRKSSSLTTDHFDLSLQKFADADCDMIVL
jgi:hypothetical protein